MKNTLSTLRSRRFAAKQQEKTKQIIAFKLFNFWFALPILAIEKVINLDSKNDSKEKNLDRVNYRDRDILLIDVVKTIFNDKLLTKSNLAPRLKSPQYIAILATNSQSSIGLPIDSQPRMYRPKISDFKPLDRANIQLEDLQCLQGQAIILSGLPTILLLNSQTLIQSYI